jgi:predicted transcriptional regulator of viral defense system
MPHTRTLSPIAGIAQDQWGLVTRRQASSAGVANATLDRLTAADGTVLERVAHGVYHLIGAPLPDHASLRAAWLQLEPATFAWRRGPDQGVVSHRSAAELCGLGHLNADRHEFTFPARRQSRRSDVRLHHRQLADRDWAAARGVLVTRPARIAADLLAEYEDPEAVGRVIADAIRAGQEYPATFADALARLAARFGLRRGDGLALLRWLLDLTGDPDVPLWVGEAAAQASLGRGPAEPPGGRQAQP